MCVYVHLQSIQTIKNQPASPARFRSTHNPSRILPYYTLRHLYSSTFFLPTTYAATRSVGSGRLDGTPSATATTLDLAPAEIPHTLLSAKLQLVWCADSRPWARWYQLRRLPLHCPTNRGQSHHDLRSITATDCAILGMLYSSRALTDPTSSQTRTTRHTSNCAYNLRKTDHTRNVYSSTTATGETTPSIPDLSLIHI